MQIISFIQLTKLQAAQIFKLRSNLFVLTIFLFAGGYALYQGYADTVRKTAIIQAFRQVKDSLLHEVKLAIHDDTATKEGKAKYSKSAALGSRLWNTHLLRNLATLSD
ncbi:MAG: hypothetical protein WKF91_04775 [Segetibacter sp.]